MKSLNLRQSWLIIILSLLGLALAYLTIVEHVDLAYGAKGFWFCSISSLVNCAAVLTSAYSEFLGIPVGCYGAIYYLLLIFLAFFSREGMLKAGKVPANVPFFLSFLGALGSLYFIGVTIFLIKSLCPLCLATYLINFCLFGLFFWWNKANWSSELKAGANSLFVGTFNALFSDKTSSAVRRSMYGALLGFGVLSSVIFWIPRWLASSAAQHVQRIPEPTKTVEEWYQVWKSSSEDNLPSSETGVLMGDFSVGPANAPVQIVEFSDFECPFCQKVARSIEAVLQFYPQHVYFIFKNFPLDKSCNSLLPHEMHKYACMAAEAARCAGEQGKFMEFSMFLFEEAFVEEPKDGGQFKRLVSDKVATTGLDRNAFDECVASSRHIKAIQRDVAQAGELKIEGTPSIWINKRRIQAETLQQMMELIDLIVSREVARSQES